MGDRPRTARSPIGLVTNSGEWGRRYEDNSGFGTTYASMRQAAFDGKARRDEQGIDGVHNLMWANDSPHHRHDCPYSRRIIAETMAGVDPAHRERIVCGNARDLYQL